MGTAAIIGGSILGSSIIGSIGSSEAADAQSDAAAQAGQAQLQMYYQTRADQAPWREAGQEAVGTLLDMVKTGPGEFEASPGYEFTKEQGLQGMERAASAMGGLRSGGLLKAAGRYSENLASQEYDNFLQRWYQSLSPWQSLAGLGQTSAQATSQAGTQAATGASNALLAQGQANAAGILGTYAPFSQLANWGATQGLNYLLYNQQPSLYSGGLAYGQNQLLPGGTTMTSNIYKGF